MDNGKLMVDTTFTVHMPVLQLIRARFPHIYNLDFKIQVLAGKRMISVDSHIITVNGNDRHGNRPMVGVGLETHSHLKIFNPLKTILRNNLSQLFVERTVGVFRGNPNFDLVTGFFPLQGILQTADDIAISVQVIQRVARTRCVQHLPGIIFQCVIYAYDRPFCNSHFLTMTPPLPASTHISDSQLLL